MHFRIQVVAVEDDGTERLQQIADLSRGDAKIETMGLTLEESKRILHDLQQVVVAHQVTAYLEQQRPCPHCQKRRKLKDSEDVPFHTLFGTMAVSNPRWEHCDCRPQAQHTFRPLHTLLPDRCSPELLYLETKWALSGFLWHHLQTASGSPAD